MNARDRKELVEKLRSLEGLTEDEKSALIGMLNTQKKYGLVWEDKPEDVEEKLRTELPVLREVPERAIISGVADAPNHIVIEGDNLEALTALTFTHAGKIDVIYIDPPYNTGNNDFKYNDNFVDKEDGYRHSKWLSFMSKRLKIAKKLLSDIGVIFISIDDNEQAQLKLLCDELFGEVNFKSTSIIVNNRGGRDYGGIALQHDYILIFGKSSFSELKLVQENEKEFKFKDDKGGFNLMELRNRNVRFNDKNRPNLFYPFYVNPEKEDSNGLLEISLEPVEGFIKVLPSISNGIQTVWRWGKEEKSRGALNIEIFGKKNRNGGYMIVQKYRKTTKMQRSIWDEKDFVNERGTEALKDLFNGEAIFGYPKSTYTIKRVLEIGSNPDSLILDFFAGSGTTMHAVMQLNAEDGGHRRCILVNNNENRICEEVTYERNKRVINGYTTPRGEVVEGLKENSLRYYKTDFIPRGRSMKNMRALMAASTDLLCVRNDVYREASFNGKKLSKKVVRYFEEGDKRMMVIYDERAIFEIVDMIREAPDGGKIIVYVFSPSSDPFRDCFEEVADRVEPVPLPSAIYDAYRRVLPKEAEQPIIESSDTEEAEP